MDKKFTITADHLGLVLCEDGEVTDALGRVIAGLRSEAHHVEADRRALAMYYGMAPEMDLKTWKRRWVRVRTMARKVLDTENHGLRAGVLTMDLIRIEALR